MIKTLRHQGANQAGHECTVFISARSSSSSATRCATSSRTRSSRSRSRPTGSISATARLPLDVLDKASQMGLRTLALPEDLGGVGADTLTCCIVTEELAVGDTDVAAVLAETSALGAAAVRGDDASSSASASCAAFLEDDAIIWRCAVPRAGRRHRARHQLPPPRAGDAPRHHRDAATAIDWIINGAKDCVANAPIAKLFAVEAQTDKGAGAVPGAARHARPHRHRAARAALVSRLLRPDCAKDCRVPADNLLGARRRRRRRAAASRSPRRSTSASAAPPTRPRSTMRSCASRAAAPSSSTRRSAPSSPRSRSGSRSRATRSGRRPGPPTIRTPSPTAACPTCRSPPSPRCSPPRRSTAPPRTPPNASAPWA